MRMQFRPRTTPGLVKIVSSLLFALHKPTSGNIRHLGIVYYLAAMVDAGVKQTPLP